MRKTMDLKRLSVHAVCAAAVLVPAVALSQDKPDAGAKAITARQGYMQVVVWNAGPLFGMAKGDVAYDAGAATAAAANLSALSQVSIAGMFPEGTSKADRPGKTRALGDIWADPARFQQAMDDWAAAVAALTNEAGKGQAELAAAAGEMGKTCGGCHKPFRADEF